MALPSLQQTLDPSRWFSALTFSLQTLLEGFFTGRCLWHLQTLRAEYIGINHARGEDVFDLNRLMANDWTEKNMNFDTTRYTIYICMTRHGAFGPMCYEGSRKSQRKQNRNQGLWFNSGVHGIDKKRQETIYLGVTLMKVSEMERACRSEESWSWFTSLML